MIVSDVQRRIRNIIGDENGVLLEQVDLWDYINDAQLDISRKTGCVVTTTTIPTIVGTAEYALPADFIYETRLTYDGRQLQRDNIANIDRVDIAKDDATNLGIPAAYYFNGNLIGLYQTPSEVKNLKIWYVKVPTAVAADADALTVPQFFHQDVVRFVKARCYEQLEQMDKSNAAMQDYTNSLAISQSLQQSGSGESYPTIRDVG